MTFKLRQGTFSYLPDLSDEQIQLQVEYCLNNEWPINLEFTDDPHPRNVYWEMWGLPMFDLKDPAGVMDEVKKCRETYPNHYIRLSGYDRTKGRQTIALSFIVNRPEYDPGFGLQRQEEHDRVIRYTVHSYATDQPQGERFADHNGK